MPRTHNGEKIISTNHAEKIGYALVGRMRLDPYLNPSIRPEQVLNTSPEAIKQLEEYTGKNFLNTGIGNDFLEMTSEAQETKAKQTRDSIKKAST